MTERMTFYCVNVTNDGTPLTHYLPVNSVQEACDWIDEKYHCEEVRLVVEDYGLLSATPYIIRPKKAGDGNGR